MVRKAEILNDHTFQDKAVHGVTFDGSNVWFASDDRLISVDPETGKVTKELEGVPSNAGTAFDGRYLWQIGAGKIRKIDPTSGEIVHTIDAPGDDNASGMAWAEGVLWVGGYKTSKIYKVNPETGEVLKELESDRLVTGVTWIDGELWHGSADESDDVELRKIDPETGAPIDRIRIEDGDYCSGVEADNTGRIWCGGKQRVRAIKQ